jgi:hypothetical protein
MLTAHLGERALVSHVIRAILDAGSAPEAWPKALEALSRELGVPSAALIVRGNLTGLIDWVCFSGLCAEFKSDYVEHYAPQDPFMPLLTASKGWLKLSDWLPDKTLRRSEWYNDFVLKCGVRDILAIRLVNTATHSVIFGLHQQIGSEFDNKVDLVLPQLEGFLTAAAVSHLDNQFGAARIETAVEILQPGKRFYFHVSNGKCYSDEHGTVFANAEEAIANATTIAGELGEDRGWSGFAIIVTDEDGDEIARIPVKNDSPDSG